MPIKSMRPQKWRRLLDNQICEIVVLSRDGTGRKTIYETNDLIEAPNWTADGKWLIYNGDGRLFRISTDGQHGPTRINTAPVEDLNNDHVIAPDGKTIYVSANDGHLYAVPIEGGTPRKISNTHAPLRQFRYFLHGISPDGETLAYVGLEKKQADGDAQATGVMTRIFTIPAAGGEDRMLTDGACPVDGPEYSPDGEWIYFNSEAAATEPGHAQIFRMRPDGSEPEQLTHDKRVNWFPHLSPDGSMVTFLSFPEGTLGHPENKHVILRTMNPDGSNQRDVDAFLGGQGTINVNSWSPDSQQFAYVSYPVRA